MIPRLIPFHISHLDQLNAPQSVAPTGPAYTAIFDDKPIACAGVIILWPGVGHAWVTIGDIKSHQLWVTRTIKRILGDIIRGCELHRVEATVLADAREHRKWIELFGFEPEGIAHEFTATRLDVVRYELVVNKPIITKEPSEDREFFTARIRGELVGYASFKYTPEGYAYGTDVQVDEPHRGRGIGRALHRARLLDVKRHGGKFFVGRSENPAMIKILESCGARRTENELGVTYVLRGTIMAFAIAIIAVAVAVIAAGVSTYMAVEAANQQAKEADAIADEKEIEAQNAVEAAAFEERQHRRRMEMLLGKQTAITAASGVGTASGSPLFAELDLVQQAELDALNIRRTGRVEADVKRFESRMASYRAENIRGTIPWTIAAGALSAASSATSIYGSYSYGRGGGSVATAGNKNHV